LKQKNGRFLLTFLPNLQGGKLTFRRVIPVIQMATTQSPMAVFSTLPQLANVSLLLKPVNLHQPCKLGPKTNFTSGGQTAPQVGKNWQKDLKLQIHITHVGPLLGGSSHLVSG